MLSSIAVFLVLGGATAFAATHLGKNSVGTKQLKANAVTAAKLKKNAVTTPKIKNGAITGTKVNLGTLGTVPNSAKTDVVKGSHGTLSPGQAATIFEYGPFKSPSNANCSKPAPNSARSRLFPPAPAAAPSPAGRMASAISDQPRSNRNVN